MLTRYTNAQYLSSNFDTYDKCILALYHLGQGVILSIERCNSMVIAASCRKHGLKYALGNKSNYDAFLCDAHISKVIYFVAIHFDYRYFVRWNINE